MMKADEDEWTMADDARRGLGTVYELRHQGTEVYWALADFRHHRRVVIHGFADGRLTCALEPLYMEHPTSSR